MNKILIVAFLLMMGIGAKAQTFGGIRGKNNAGTQGDVKRDADALKVSDSTLKVRIDSLLVYNRADSLTLSNIEAYLSSIYSQETGVNPLYYEEIILNGKEQWVAGSATASAVNNLFTNSSVVTKMEIPNSAISSPRFYKTLRVFMRVSGTVSVGGNVKLQGSTDSSTWDEVMLWDIDSLKNDGYLFNVVAATEKKWSVPVQYPYYRLYSPGITGGGTIQAWALLSQSSFAPSIVGVDSNQFRQTIKISEMPSVSVDSTTGSRITHKISELVPLVAGTAYIGKTRLTDGTTDAEVVPLAGYNAGAVAIVDGSGNQITSFGGGTQYAEGTTTDPATGTAALMRYKSTDPTLANGEMSAPLLTERGETRTLQKNGALVTDNITSNGDYVTIPCDGYNSILIAVTGGATATLNAQYSTDGSTYSSSASAYPFSNILNTPSLVQTVNASTIAMYRMQTNGAKSIRIIATAYTSGTCTINASANNYNQEMFVANTTTLPLHVNIAGLSSSSGYYWAAEDNASSGGGTISKTGLVRQDALTSSASNDLDYIDAKATKFGSILAKDEERHKVTYTASFSVTPASSCTDIYEIKSGASKDIHIQKVVVSGTQTTAGVTDIRLYKRSTVNTGGTSSAHVPVTHISSDAASNATGSIYTANPTTGTNVGAVATDMIYFGVTTEPCQFLTYDFGEQSKPIILRANTTEAFAINMNSRTITGGKIYVRITWTEE